MWIGVRVQGLVAKAHSPHTLPIASVRILVDWRLSSRWMRGSEIEGLTHSAEEG
jgi:hypothetical protein